MTTKNRTVPLILSTRKTDDISETESGIKILSSTNISYGYKNSIVNNRNVWNDETDELLLSSDVNATIGDYDTHAMWKRSINDAVSKNITMVLENLLKNYENSQLPTHGKGCILHSYKLAYPQELLKKILAFLC